ncbi:PREDICTED: glutamate carboxypeptidase 2-like [Tinamus guttatus]|uniref:glutamate carboxypeptidase 2-like n=1 Tax=Tinamus guttatus TaxID=94827 RepID=UPI00052E9F3A|nr:PREDICTED: glutamate carboxypeptidase 2-like [Tinamus guttatus]
MTANFINFNEFTVIRGQCLGALGMDQAQLTCWFAKPTEEKTSLRPHEEMKKAFMAEMKVENIKKFLYNFTRLPHLAGTEENLHLAKQIQAEWKDFGLDSVQLAHYDILLSYPDETKPNYISIIDELGNEIFNTSLFEPPPSGYEAVRDVVPPYSAFSAQGMPEGELVYVNYGRTEDFFKLEREMGINCTGKIVIARYGKIFRGNKVKNAESAGAKGVILYSDPADYCAPGVNPYPAGWNLPGGGAQRGNILNLNGAGDPLTPGYPAKEYTYRLDKDSGVGLPKIPVHPIGYHDAESLLRNLNLSQKTNKCSVLVPESVFISTFNEHWETGAIQSLFTMLTRVFCTGLSVNTLLNQLQFQFKELKIPGTVYKRQFVCKKSLIAERALPT